jgi:hypothetical protein
MKKLLLIVLIVFGYAAVYAQNGIGLNSYIRLIDAAREYKPIEKLYLQTDKPYYTLGDTIRLKGYLLNADYFTPTNRSGMLYVELDDQEGKPAKRMMLPVTQGLAWGDIALDEKETPHGSYTLRAYTNWMRNFGEDYIYKKDIYISPATGNATLVKANFKQEGNKVETTLQFTSLDGKPLLVKDMELKVMDGKKNLSKDQLNTGMGGILNANFELPQTTTGPITIQAKDVTKGTTDATTLIIPVTINRPEHTDLQFMPEGGNLVAGIKTKVGFKAIAEDGKGTNITGRILNSKQQEVASFKTTHAGMGSFEFTPQANETYTAKVNGITKSYTLPIVNPTGTTLRVEQPLNSDSLTITVTTNQTSTNNTYNLIGQSRGVVCFAQTINFNNNNPTQIFKAPKSAFPTGIARFTVINASHQPINERQVFINRNDQLNISITTNQPTYGIRDSIALAIQVKDKDGKPVQGIFSLGVTDDSQVKTDSLASNILNNLLLTSDLKGNIETPNYYFINQAQKQAELDNLMLTQGWVGYDWKDVFYPSANPITYQPETEFTINGTVTNAFGKPIEKSNVVIMANNPLTFKDTLTNKEGRFRFNNLFPVDTAIYKLQARNKNGKEMNVGIKMDEIKAPDFTKPSQIIPPWYVNSDSIRLSNTSAKSAQQKAIANYKGEGNMLKEVTIKERKIVKGSKNLNGPGEADLIIDEEELKKADKMTLGDLLEKKVKGFTVNGIWGRVVSKKGYITSLLAYTLDTKKIKFSFDGVDLDYYFTGIPNRYLFIKSYLDYFMAEDIMGIEVMNSPKYAGTYHGDMGRNEIGISPTYYAYIEITTRSKQGPFMKVTPGTYLYKTLPFTLPKQFYSPKYTVKNKTVAMGTDMRSTLHWEPNIITDAEGKATVSFFTADKPANYTVIMEGANLTGDIGYKRQKIKSTLTK